MTAQEKAKELFCKFWYLSPQGIDRLPYKKYAKLSALIAVTELIALATDYDEIKPFSFSSSRDFYDEVKKEIEKL